MKKAIYISGIVALNLFLFGALMKILHWPGANYMLILSIAIFVFWFIPSSLINHFRSLDKPSNPTLHILVFVVCALDFVGALFKIVHWPGASWLMMIGIPAPFVLFLPVYLIGYNKQKRKPDGNFFAVMFLFVYIAIISVFLALQVGKEVIDHGVMRADKMQATYSGLKTLSADWATDPSREEVKKKTDGLCASIDRIKAGLVEACQEDASEIVNDDGSIDLFKMHGSDNREASKAYFSQPPDADNLNRLLKEMNGYREYLLGFIPEQQAQKRDFVNKSLDTSHIFYKPEMQPGSPGINLAYISLMMAINHLSYMQTQIRLAELQVL